jgi:YVTN family beta-propeller protein
MTTFKVSYLVGSLMAALLARQTAPTSAPRATPTLDFGFYRAAVEPILLAKRPGNVRCVTCHAGGASSALRLQPLSPGATSWTEEQSRQNFEALQRMVTPGANPLASRLLTHPLARAAGGDPFHGGGKHWMSQDDPEWQVLAAWAAGEKSMKPLTTKVRIIQTNAAGDNTHVIDPATNKVVGVINDIEVPHGVTSAPDGSRLYISDESLETLDVVDARTLHVTQRIRLSGRPNNVAISKDGKKVYVGIAQGSGALDVIDTGTLTNVKSIPVKGAVHNVYVTPDGKYVVSGSVGARTISIVDAATETLSRAIGLDAGIRPMAFDTNPDGSTKNIYVQLSNFHGFAVVDFASGKETKRIEHPAVPGVEAHKDGLQGAPAHGLAVTPDGKTLWSTSKVYGYAYVYALPDLKEIGRVFVGQHPEWVTLTPDGRFIYVAAAGDNMVFVVDVKNIKEVARIPVGQVPKRNTTALLQTR